jgi:serine/threonine protein kinase
MQSFCGTVHYIAPEIFLSKGNYGPKIDIWSLGIVFLEAIRPMFMSSLQKTVGYKQYTLAVENELQLLKRNKELSKVEKDIIRGMLYATPSRRLTAARCLELGCESGLFRKTRQGNFIYEAGDAVPGETAEPVIEQSLATIDEDVHNDGVAENAAPARSCYNIPSEATTHQESGDTTPRATGSSTPLARESSVLQRLDVPVEENEEVSKYFPAASGSRAPMHHVWSEVSQRREPSRTSIIDEITSATHDVPQSPSTLDDTVDGSDYTSVIGRAETVNEPVQAAIDPLSAALDGETTTMYHANRTLKPAKFHRRSDPEQDPRVIAILNDLRAHKAKTTRNWKRRAPEDDAQHILETQVVPAKKIKSSPLYPSWYNSLWTPDKGVTK